MNPFSKYKLLSICLFLSTTFLAQTKKDEDYVNDKQLRYEDYIYKPNIKTAQLYVSGWEFSPALIDLSKGETFTLAFDDLDSDKKTYSYTFIHCDAKWNPSDLMTSEYLTGFFDGNFYNFNYSVNTLQKYTHWTVNFPTQNMTITKLGNYIVYVYLNGDKENLVLSRRFMVFDNKVNVTANCQQAIGNNDQLTKQHIDFTITSPGYEITNPYTDLKVVLVQNNRWDNAVYDIKPTFATGQGFTYSLDNASTFSGGNEFRYFDTRSLRTYTERVKNMYKDKDNKNHVELLDDEVKTVKGYMFYGDLNGGYQIRNTDNSVNMDIEADYTWVNFILKYDTPASDGNFYILGKLTDWKLDKGNRMTYNESLFRYECSLYLKQGYYNYSYALLRDKTKAGDETVTEGSYWQTENDYTIYVYHRQRGTYYDQLIGVKKFNSVKK